MLHKKTKKEALAAKISLRIKLRLIKQKQTMKLSAARFACVKLEVQLKLWTTFGLACLLAGFFNWWQAHKNAEISLFGDNSRKITDELRDLGVFFAEIYYKFTHFTIMRLRAVQRPFFVAVLILLLLDLALPKLATAQEIQSQNINFKIFGLELNAEESSDQQAVHQAPADEAVTARLPLASDKIPKKIILLKATAYNSEPGQTDDTPCITASGLNACEHGKEDIIAANFLPIGTYVRFPDLFGDKIFRVEDRMNRRYHYRVDFWFKDKNDALKFGLQTARMEVF